MSLFQYSNTSASENIPWYRALVAKLNGPGRKTNLPNLPPGWISGYIIEIQGVFLGKVDKNLEVHKQQNITHKNQRVASCKSFWHPTALQSGPRAHLQVGLT